LVEAAELEAPRLAAANANPALSVNWAIVQRWSEKTRYEQKTEADARTLFEAVTARANGVLPWIRTHW